MRACSCGRQNGACPQGLRFVSKKALIISLVTPRHEAFSVDSNSSPNLGPTSAAECALGEQSDIVHRPAGPMASCDSPFPDGARDPVDAVDVNVLFSCSAAKRASRNGSHAGPWHCDGTSSSMSDTWLRSRQLT